MLEPKRIEWLSHWDGQITPDRQESYVREELARLAADGQPLLYAALTANFLDQTDVAVRALKSVQPTVFLRLVDGAAPPPLDPQGRELPEAERGKVLVAAVGVRGQMDASELARNPGLARQYSGSNRRALAMSRDGLDHTVRITREPVALPLEAAIVVLRAWGHGVVNEEQRYRPRTERKYMLEKETGMERMHERVVRQDRWLVEEVPVRNGVPLVEAPAAHPKKTAA